MVKVRTFEPFFGLDFVEESVWGTDPTTGYLRLDFSSEDLHAEDDVFSDSQEFTSIGALTGIEKGRRIVTGTITVEPKYNSPAFWTFFAQAWSHENLVVETDVLGATIVDLNTHIFTPSLTLPVGATFRVWKSGPTNAGSVDIVEGCLCTGWTWDQPEGDRATLSMNFIGKAQTIDLDGGSALTLATAETAREKLKAIDFDETVRGAGGAGYAEFRTGQALTKLNVSGFTITVDRSIEAGTGFLPSLLALDKPGITGNRSVTLDITGVLEQDYGGTNKPAWEFEQGLTSQAVIIYEGGTLIAPDISATTPHAIRFDMPAIEWTDVRRGATQPGEIPFSASARGFLGDLTGLTSGFDDHTGVPSGGTTDIRCLVQVNDADDTDAVWSNLTTA